MHSGIAGKFVGTTAPHLPGFRHSPWFGEQIREEWRASGIRFFVNAGEVIDPSHPTQLLIYATPNGNTLEQTLGSALDKDAKTDWHFDIQHIAAQTRTFRQQSPGENIFLAVVQAETLSWPAWRQAHADNAAQIRQLVDDLRQVVQANVANPVRVTITGHSGGGSFLWGFLNGGPDIPMWVERIALLDANYSYSDTDRHGDKMLAWLSGNSHRRLFVLAYDDRNILYEGKKVVGPDGGTFRASQRMVTRFAKDEKLVETRTGDWLDTSGKNGQIAFHIHTNPQNAILHTALVGEWNGFLAAVTDGPLIKKRAYTPWIRPAGTLPPRPRGAIGGTAFGAQVARLAPADREEAIVREVLRGNIPPFLRQFVTVTVRGKDSMGRDVIAECDVMPDYLAVGSDTDFVRVPMTPYSAQLLADAFGCSLPTRLLVEAVYAQARLKLEPRPLTEAREAWETFARHNAIIEEQRAGKPLGILVAGIKKDVVLTNRLGEKPGRVAIYGWHKLDGIPIQPLTIIHRETYVDYSHGIRLVRRSVRIDGKPRDMRDALAFPPGSSLSDEGLMTKPTY